MSINQVNGGRAAIKQRFDQGSVNKANTGITTV